MNPVRDYADDEIQTHLQYVQISKNFRRLSQGEGGDTSMIAIAAEDF